jgi:hypothetical protein
VVYDQSMSSQKAQLQDAQKVQLGDTHEAERMDYKVHLAIYLTAVVEYGPMLDEVLGLLGGSLVNEVNSNQMDRTIWMFGNYRIPV